MMDEPRGVNELSRSLSADNYTVPIYTINVT
jgi:hypothetical protein